MIGLDTNIIIRFLTNDDLIQSKKVYNFFKKSEQSDEKLFISSCVLLECIWVLESAYNYGREEILKAIKELYHLPYIKFENESVISSFFVQLRKSKIELSDGLIGLINISKKCDYTLTFDKDAAKELSEFHIVK